MCTCACSNNNLDDVSHLYSDVSRRRCSVPHDQTLYRLVCAVWQTTFSRMSCLKVRSLTHTHTNSHTHRCPRDARGSISAIIVNKHTQHTLLNEHSRMCCRVRAEMRHRASLVHFTHFIRQFEFAHHALNYSIRRARALTHTYPLCDSSIKYDSRHARTVRVGIDD